MGKQYESGQHGFRLSIPDGWKVVEEGSPIVIRVVPEQESSDLKNVSMNLMVGDVDQKEPIKLSDMPAEEPNPLTGEVIKYSPRQFFGQEGRETHFEVPAPDGSSEKLQIWQVMTVRKGNVVYQFTFGAPLSAYAAVEDVGRGLLESLEFVDVVVTEIPIPSMFLATYESKRHGFRCRYPWGGWTLQSDVARGPAMESSYAGPLSAKDTTPVVMHFRVNVSALPRESMTLDEYAELHRSAMAESTEDGEEPSMNAATVDEKPAVRLDYVDVDGKHCVQLVTVHQGHVFTITTQSDVGPTDKRVAKILTRLRRSFEFLPQSGEFESFAATLTYDNLLKNFSVRYTQEFSAHENMGSQVMFLRRAPGMNGPDDPPLCTIGVVVDPLMGAPISVSNEEEYVAFLRELISSQLPGGRLVSETKVKMAGRLVPAITYAGTLDEGMEVLFEQRFVFVDGRHYVVTVNAPAFLFDEQLKECSKLLSSFSVYKD